MKLPEYPRTLHLADSGGRESKHSCALDEIAGQHLVIEEKVDGSHCGLSFDEQAELRVFTRNTVLESPPVRHDFRLLDQLAREAIDELWEVLGDRYVLYGEWARVAHTVYYDALPSYFLEDDIFDRVAGRFLSTPRRQALVAALPPAFSRSVVVLHGGSLSELAELHALVGPSTYKSERWRERCPDLAAVEDHDEMEGLYIKQEDPDFVLRRLKWIRPGFLAHIAASGNHWRARDELLNRLADE
ncbi:MAG TPA: RNA ligase family protein [Enhygromyxa sp.]|nr:RNA ligase family protein [Enhygromyxa sp.]